MRRTVPFLRLFIVVFAAASLGACAVIPPPRPYDAGVEIQQESGPPISSVLGPNDQTYIMQVEDYTHFGFYSLPASQHILYSKGYDEVRRSNEADFSVDVILSAVGRENPGLRAGHTLGGALLGAATGAIIGGAFRNPGAGAAIGAASGGALGLLAPARTGILRIDLSIYSFRERQNHLRSETIDLAHVPPPDLHFVVDSVVSRMLQGLPRK